MAAPRADDIRNLYRHDRAPVPAMGYLGIRSPEETTKLAKIMMERNGAANQFVPEDAAGSASAPPPSMRAVYSEPVYYFIPRQEPSPRSVGAERHDAQMARAGAAAVAQWRSERARTIAASFTAFSIVSIVICLVFLGPWLAPLVIAAAKRVHRACTHDEAVAWLKAVIEEERVSATAEAPPPPKVHASTVQPSADIGPAPPAKPKPLVIRKPVADLPNRPTQLDWTVAPAV